ncbi:glycoside hydrolase [Cunninghamella echinulata]|nr:glycoside hydrolase [Cunninghamella echinulata]
MGKGATIIDSLDTLYIMGLTEEFEKAKNYVATIDWKKDTKEVQIFEVVIRYVGGLISAYELSQEKIFIKKCVELVNLLLPAFNSSTNIPYRYIDLNTGQAIRGSEITNIAEAASFQLEFTRLSQITGEWKYHFIGQRVYEAFKKMKTSYEGLFPHHLSIITGEVASDYYTWGGEADSFYEYLIKQYKWTKDEDIKNMAIKAVKGLQTNLLQQPNGKEFQHLKYVGAIKDGQPESSTGELVCFVPATLLLAAREIPELATVKDSIEQDAHSILLGCYQTWVATRTGLAPETFAWIPYNNTNHKDLNTRQIELAKKYGVFPDSGAPVNYVLRPETLESIFYFYQYNKDPIYQDMAWTIFKNINQHCKAPYGYSGVNEVDATSPRWNDRQESFFFAETLKYLYLIYDEESRYPFDQWVFNTEAHPFRITDIQPPIDKSNNSL